MIKLFSFLQVKILSQKELSGNGRVYLIVANSSIRRAPCRCLYDRAVVSHV